MTLFLLAHTSPARVFAVATAINEMDALAVAPRAYSRVRDRAQKGKHVWADTPVLMGYIFIACTEAQYHAMARGLQAGPGRRIKAHIVRHINPAEWATVQAFAARTEQDYAYACEVAHRAADPNFGFKPGDHLALLSDSLRDTMARFVGVKAGMIEAEVTMFGAARRITVAPDKVVAAVK